MIYKPRTSHRFRNTHAAATGSRFHAKSREKQSYLEKKIFENKTIDIRQSYQCENIACFFFFIQKQAWEHELLI